MGEVRVSDKTRQNRALAWNEKCAKTENRRGRASRARASDVPPRVILAMMF